jgi:hypothetical protein
MVGTSVENAVFYAFWFIVLFIQSILLTKEIFMFILALSLTRELTGRYTIY